MERQLQLDLTDAAERERRLRVFLGPLGLHAREIAVLCLMAGHGDRREVSGNSVSTLAIGKKAASKLAGVAPNTFLRGVHDLEARGLLGVLRNTEPWIYVANWSRVGRLEPPPADLDAAIAALPVIAEPWSHVVQARSTLGHNPVKGARDSVKNVNAKSVLPCNRVPCSSTGAAGRLDQPDQVERPWARDGGVTDAELVAAVGGRRLRLLRRLYDEAVSLGWIGDSEDARLRFLTLCHHAATSSGMHSRMAVLVARTKQGLRVGHVRQDSEEWARRCLTREHAEVTE